MVSEAAGDVFTPFGRPGVAGEDDERGARRAPPQARIPPEKPIDASMTKTEITRALALLYNLSHRLLGIEDRYKPVAFAEEADGIYDLIQAHAPFRIILRLASPLAAVGALWEKVEDTMAQVREKKAKAEVLKRKLAGNAGIPLVEVNVGPGVAGKAPFKP